MQVKMTFLNGNWTEDVCMLMTDFDVKQAHSKIRQMFLCGVSEENQRILFL
jgi:hypothetical protein